MTSEVEEARDQMNASQRRIGEIERQIRNYSPETQAALIAPLQRELKRHRSRSEAAQENFVALSRVHTAVRAWIDQLGAAAELEDAEGELVSPKSGEHYADAVLRVRAEIDELRGARSKISRAVAPLDELYAQADAHVDALAARGTPSLRFEGDRLVIRHEVEGYADQAIVHSAWLFPDRMKEQLREEIDRRRARETTDRLTVMSSTERAAKLRMMDRLILEKEREEESLIRDAEQENTAIRRREKASPLAILGVRFAVRDAQPAPVQPQPVEAQA
ncbi:hypothetical protein [Bradyrhizobium sp. Pha-3]|uniref:hypothetical protein n=1 Tax=Bradyrhizobium TaxID=374 RepID=UPI0035D3FBD2